MWQKIPGSPCLLENKATLTLHWYCDPSVLILWPISADTVTHQCWYCNPSVLILWPISAASVLTLWPISGSVLILWPISADTVTHQCWYCDPSVLHQCWHCDPSVLHQCWYCDAWVMISIYMYLNLVRVVGMYKCTPPLPSPSPHTHAHTHMHCLQAGCVYLKTTIDARRDLFWTSLQMHWRQTVRDGSFGPKSHSWTCGGRSRARPRENSSESELCLALFQLFRPLELMSW